VASLASLFAAPMTHATQPIPIEPMLDMSYRSLAQLETRLGLGLGLGLGVGLGLG
jgi:hypothetical protein